tara:strand:- start:328 stop:567 length:240 start_codon:yes stop_codon:yes gene_type:complete
MIRRKTERKPVINLDGPDGNAFALMAYAKRFAKDMGYVSDEAILNLMMDGDYTNLVRTFDKYFGEYVILETTNEELLNA